jgi:hypothetical protein
MTPALPQPARGETLFIRIAAIASIGVGLIHAAVAREHFAEWWAYGLFFIFLALFQSGWALAAWRGARRRLLLAGILVNAAALALWVLTRTSGLPFGPEPGVPEAIGVADAACGALELAVVLLGTLALWRAFGDRGYSRVAALAALGTAGLTTLLLIGAAVAAPEVHGQQLEATGCAAPMADMAHGDASSMTDGERHALAQLPDVACATAADTQAASDLLHRTIAATAQYRDIQAAAAAGYKVDAAFRRHAADHPKARKQQAQIVHVGKPAFRRDGKVADPTAPEMLIYQRDAAGKTELIGVMYTAPDRQPGPDLAGPYTRWHYHDTCRAADQTKVAKQGGNCPSGTQEVVSGYMMHVWFVQDSDLPYAYAMRVPLAQVHAYQQQVP